MTAEFQRLNILLLRAVTGKMIGTALLTEVRVHSTLGEQMSASGSLGGLQIMNLLTGSTLHQKIFSVGKDPVSEEYSRQQKHDIHTQLYPQRDPEGEGQDRQALTFDINQEYFYHDDTCKQRIDLQLRMASVCYLHSASFLEELNSCATDFKQYMSNLAQSIRSAATDLAFGIVHRRTESIGPSMDEVYSIPSSKRPTLGRSGSFRDYGSLDRRVIRGVKAPAPTPKPTHAPVEDFRLHLDVVMETPIVVVPRHERSFEVLVAHLGGITIRNEVEDGVGCQPKVERVVVHVTDMNVHSANLSDKIEKKSADMDWLNVLTELKRFTAQELYSCTSSAVPMLHDTAVELCIEKLTAKKPRESDSYHSFVMDDLDAKIGSGLGETWTSYQIKSKVTNPVKLSLHRSQYEQILDSLKNISPRQESEAAASQPSAMDCGSSEDESHVNLGASLDGSFQVPHFMFELLGDDGKGLVCLKFNEFAVLFANREQHKNSIELTLGSLVMEDLVLGQDSPHRILATSISKERRELPMFGNLSNPGLSSSCPEFWYHESEMNLSTSLPQNLNTETVFGSAPRDAAFAISANVFYGGKKKASLAPPAPATPPPSACSSRASPIEDIKRDLSADDNLVHIQVLNVDPKAPDFMTRHQGNNRHIDVDFNTLDIMFNLQSWVIVLDFFGIGKAEPEANANARKSHATPTKSRSAQKFNTEIDVKVKSLSVILNKPEYEVASATAKNYTSKISLRDNNFAISGSLGNFSLKDLTSNGLLYKDRFVSRGEEAFNFHLFKFGTPDENLQRAQDATLQIRMSSIIYVHTQRFYSELFSFFNNFQRLQNITRSTILAEQCRGSRIRLDLEAGSPLLILPMSSFSSQLLVIDLGRLEVHNTFKFSGDEGTISAQNLAAAVDSFGRRSRARSGSRSSRSSVRSRSRSTAKSPAPPGKRHRPRVRGLAPGSGVVSSEEDVFPPEPLTKSGLKKCLLDVMFVSLKTMDLRTAERLSPFAEDVNGDDIVVGNFILRLNSTSVLKEKVELKLQIERNLDKAFNHGVPDLSVKGVLSLCHISIDLSQYKLVRGLLAYNLGECVDDLNLEPISTTADESEEEEQYVWTGMFMNIELQDVILDLMTAPATCMARVNLIKSRLIYESFSDSSRDIDLVSQEILLNDLRFADFPMNKRTNVFTKILKPMNIAERTSLLQAEVHFRATQDTNRFTILLNNMRLMGIFDWWTAVLEFISQSAENPNPPTRKLQPQPELHKPAKFYEEPLYPTAGIVTRRAPILETSGPVFELKVNVTDSELIIVADSSQSDSSTVILRSTTVIAYRPDFPERPFSCNLNNAEVFSCVLGDEAESALSIIDPVTINVEISGGRSLTNPSKGLLDPLDSEDTERTVEVQLQQLNVRLSYHDWIMFQTILESFPRQANQAMAAKSTGESPVNIRGQITQLLSLGFSRADCQVALELCKGKLDEAALWLTQNAVPEAVHSESSTEADESIKAVETRYLDGSKVSFGSIEFKSSCVNVCIIDDCKDADVPLLEMMLQQLHLKHEYGGKGKATSTLSGSYYNRALSCWEPFMEPWRCLMEWKSVPIGEYDWKRTTISMESGDTVNFNMTSTLVELYQMVKTNWTEDYYHNAGGQTRTSRRRAPFVPFALKNDTGSDVRFCTQTRMAASQFAARQPAQEDEGWKRIGAGETLPFSFEVRGKMRHTNSHDVKVHQLIVKVDGWQPVTPVSVDRVGIYFRHALALPGSDLPPSRVVVEVKLEGSARKLVTVRSALMVSNSLPFEIQLKLVNSSFKVDGNFLEMLLFPEKILTKKIKFNFRYFRIQIKTKGKGSSAYVLRLGQDICSASDWRNRAVGLQSLANRLVPHHVIRGRLNGCPFKFSFDKEA